MRTRRRREIPRRTAPVSTLCGRAPIRGPSPRPGPKATRRRTRRSGPPAPRRARRRRRRQPWQERLRPAGLSRRPRRARWPISRASPGRQHRSARGPRTAARPRRRRRSPRPLRAFGRRVALAAAVASGTQTNAEAAEHNASRPRSRASAAGEYASPSSAGSNACFAKTSETCTQVASAGAPTTRGSRPISTAAFMQRFQLPCCLCSGFSCLRFQLPMAAAGVAHSLQPSDQVWKGSDESSNVTISGSTIGGFQGS